MCTAHIMTRSIEQVLLVKQTLFLLQILKTTTENSVQKVVSHFILIYSKEKVYTSSEQGGNSQSTCMFSGNGIEAQQ